MMPNLNGGAVYRKSPLRTTKTGIPVFSETSEYIENYDEISSTHLKSLQESGVNPFMSDVTWTTLDQSTLEMMRRYVQAPDVLLDAGVGLGGLLAGFPENRRYGVDISLDYLEITRQSGIDVCMSLLEELPYESNVFDFVLSTDVLEHVLDFYRATKEIVRVLKPGGLLGMSVAGAGTGKRFNRAYRATVEEMKLGNYEDIIGMVDDQQVTEQLKEWYQESLNV